MSLKTLSIVKLRITKYFCFLTLLRQQRYNILVVRGKRELGLMITFLVSTSKSFTWGNGEIYFLRVSSD